VERLEEFLSLAPVTFGSMRGRCSRDGSPAKQCRVTTVFNLGAKE
jgi:hypothetical protein